ncbi:MerR family transcriptional regulator [Jiella mangrovi]|uniref:MerR family transcriptional regulator n=1 Tax=Jiella mangrovi TaxID=2821407 RepID=A0ABS4BMQ8_9HYPH|nr:MerR family transcriptional regulator [Jiella mangrovi]MBP0618032.1 MerR family transcriptional regulator [Jiella mangrovi]
MPDEETFSIKDLEQEFGLTLRTLRFYEERGLVRPGRRGEMRVYSTADKKRLELITRFKTLGFPLSEVKQIVDLYEAPLGRRENMKGLETRLREQREVLSEQCRALEKMLRLMDETLAEVNGELSDEDTRDLHGGN